MKNICLEKIPTKAQSTQRFNLIYNKPYLWLLQLCGKRKFKTVNHQPELMYLQARF